MHIVEVILLTLANGSGMLVYTAIWARAGWQDMGACAGRDGMGSNVVAGSLVTGRLTSDV